MLAIASLLPPWVWMWVLVGGLFLGLKLVTLKSARRTLSGRSALCFVFLWPGMDLRPFRRQVGCVLPEPWAPGVMMVLVGIAMLWGLAPRVSEVHLGGWVGMIGIVCVAHFGIFRLLACWWQRQGFPVEPIMKNPLEAKTLGAFWGQHWNRAFSDFATRVILRPVARWAGIHGGLLGVFAFSGLAHELIISVPAGGGYGGPMGYFVLQGIAVVMERSAGGRRLHRVRPVFTRTLMWIVIVVPAVSLFHAPFMRNVIHPFLLALHPL